jgi:uncharacterized repeat protein (TIGR02543 family)
VSKMYYICIKFNSYINLTKMKHMKRVYYSLLIAGLVAATGCEELVDKTFEVTFDSQGGSAVASQMVAVGDKVTEPEEPTNTSGEAFDGWYKESACTNEWDFANDRVIDNTTLYAKWSNAATYTVSFNSNGGSAVASQRVAEGRTATRPTSPTKQGEAFAGWYADSLMLDGEYNFSTPIRADLRLHAKWIVVTVDDLIVLMDETSLFMSYNYTEESWWAYEEARSAAMSQVGSDIHSLTPAQLVSAYTALRAAVDLLVSLPHRAAAAIQIYNPAPVEGVVYVAIGDNTSGWLSMHVEAVDEQGRAATNSDVEFDYSQLESWIDTDNLNGSEIATRNGLQFPLRADVELNQRAELIIRSAENPNVSLTVTVELVDAEAMKQAFIEGVNNLPDLTTLTLNDVDVVTNEIKALYAFQQSLNTDDEQVRDALDRLRMYENEATRIMYKLQFIAAAAALPEPAQITEANEQAVDEAYGLYYSIDENGRNEPAVIDAYSKLQACREVLDNLSEMPQEQVLSYTFSGNTVTLTDEEGAPVVFTYASSGTFPNGTYTSNSWMENMSCTASSDGIGECVVTGYTQVRITLNADKTFKQGVRTATDAQGGNASAWQEMPAGTYEINGDSEKGTLTLTSNSNNTEEPAVERPGGNGPSAGGRAAARPFNR